ncbi:MAG: hypothetical protein EOP45_03080 [Sphingobacteriaceae bacterium]|nr:MAG: hypothetical protein EOP45_03080 [Sphingobacteriaceae bacterium]
MSDVTLTPVQIKLVNLLEEFFYPVKEASAGQVFYTTRQIYDKLQSIWPTDSYTTEDLLGVLLYKDYARLNSTTDKVFWILQFKE